MMTVKNAKKQIDYWFRTAANDLETAQIIFDAGKNYHHCLFFCHLVLEKGLKANVVRTTGAVPPKIHNLLLLAERAEMLLTQEQKDFLRFMNGFNIEGRYPDEQFEIYKRTTKALAKELFTKTKEQFEWMRKLARQ